MQQSKFYLVALFLIIFFPLRAVIHLDIRNSEFNETDEILEELKKVEGHPHLDISQLLIAKITLVTPAAYVICNSAQEVAKIISDLKENVQFFILENAHKYNIFEGIGTGSYLKKNFP